MHVAERMLGVGFTPIAATLWHPDVRAYALSDAGSGKPLATLYIDPCPREGETNAKAFFADLER